MVRPPRRVLRRFGLESTVRASLAPYNTCEDIDALVAALLRLQGGRGPPCGWVRAGLALVNELSVAV
jgi:hypothetical protein